MTHQEGLQLFTKFLKKITEAVIKNEKLPDRKFRNSIAGVSRTIPIFLQSEGEEYGMTLQIYDCLMTYKKAKPSRFQSMMTQGNFSLEGSASYSARKVVIYIPDEQSELLLSHVPASFLEVIGAPEVEATVGIKRKAGERGPGKKNFASDRTAVVVSQNLTKSLSDVIENYLKSNTNESNKREIIEASMNSIIKTYQIKEENVESENAIILSAKTYLKGLSLYGGRFIDTQATIDAILTALAAKNVTNKSIAASLGVSKLSVTQLDMPTVERGIRLIRIITRDSNPIT